MKPGETSIFRKALEKQLPVQGTEKELSGEKKWGLETETERYYKIQKILQEPTGVQGQRCGEVINY